MGGPCDFSVSPSPFCLYFGTLDFGTSDLGLTILRLSLKNILNQSKTYIHFSYSTVQSFIGALLKKNPTERLTGEDVKRHEFFSGIDWALLEAGEAEPPFR